mmetsp:Transcript_14312/g.39352  ORF Transcript_14312/g.39352 Transcript_14312/m.39352 type:complete len:240 (-) Transcript_14312:63-782(-)
MSCANFSGEMLIAASLFAFSARSRRCFAKRICLCISAARSRICDFSLMISCSDCSRSLTSLDCNSRMSFLIRSIWEFFSSNSFSASSYFRCNSSRPKSSCVTGFIFFSNSCFSRSSCSTANFHFSISSSKPCTRFSSARTFDLSSASVFSYISFILSSSPVSFSMMTSGGFASSLCLRASSLNALHALNIHKSVTPSPLERLSCSPCNCLPAFVSCCRNLRRVPSVSVLSAGLLGGLAA